MPRRARFVVPGYPHHVTQRGNRRQTTFYSDDDYRKYLSLLTEALRKVDVKIWAYCLMPNHVHIIAVPGNADDLARLFREAHHRYARYVNARNEWQGHLWQERFYSTVMDEEHLLAAARYIELNPVRAGLCRRPDEWRWSSLHAHMKHRADPIICAGPLEEIVSDWATFLSEPDDNSMYDDIRRSTRVGWPVGGDSFLAKIEMITGKRARRMRPGPKPMNKR